MPTKKPLSFEVHQFLKTLFAQDLHAKRVHSQAGPTLGVIESASLAVGIIGQGLALARGRLAKHAVKQVDRLLSNPGIDVDALLRHWVPYVVGSRSSITVAMDWTSFDADGQTTIMLSLIDPENPRRCGCVRHQLCTNQPQQRVRAGWNRKAACQPREIAQLSYGQSVELLRSDSR